MIFVSTRRLSVPVLCLVQFCYVSCSMSAVTLLAMQVLSYSRKRARNALYPLACLQIACVPSALVQLCLQLMPCPTLQCCMLRLCFWFMLARQCLLQVFVLCVAHSMLWTCVVCFCDSQMMMCIVGVTWVRMAVQLPLILVPLAPPSLQDRVTGCCAHSCCAVSSTPCNDESMDPFLRNYGYWLFNVVVWIADMSSWPNGLGPKAYQGRGHLFLTVPSVSLSVWCAGSYLLWSLCLSGLHGQHISCVDVLAAIALPRSLPLIDQVIRV